jgi:transposase-like protein
VAASSRIIWATRPVGTKPDDATNHRNGTSGKTVLTDDGPVAIEVPRDRDGTFEPRLIGKHERRFTGFDDKVLALYARGMTVREIQAFLAEMYGVEVSPDLISTVTDGIVAESPPGRRGRSMRCIRWCSSMPCASRFATKRWS